MPPGAFTGSTKRLAVAGVVLASLLSAPPVGTAAEVWVMDTPRGAQSIGVSPTIGPYSSATACEEVNRRSFGGQGKCRLQSRTQEPPTRPEAIAPPPTPRPQVQETVKKYVEALERDPEDAQARRGLGRLLTDLVNQGRRRDAAEAYIMLGQMLQRQGRSAQALAAYRHAGELDSTVFLRAQYDDARKLGDLQDLADAISVSGGTRLKEEWRSFCHSRLPYTICAPERRPTGDADETRQPPEPRAEPSRAEQPQDAPREAAKRYVAALQLDPDNLQARKGLGRLLTDLVNEGRRREAAEIYVDLGQMLARQGLSDAASKAYQKARELDPGLNTLQAPPAPLPPDDFLERLNRTWERRE